MFRVKYHFWEVDQEIVKYYSGECIDMKLNNGCKKLLLLINVYKQTSF